MRNTEKKRATAKYCKEIVQCAMWDVQNQRKRINLVIFISIIMCLIIFERSIVGLLLDFTGAKTYSLDILLSLKSQ